MLPPSAAVTVTERGKSLLPSAGDTGQTTVSWGPPGCVTLRQGPRTRSWGAPQPHRGPIRRHSIPAQPARGTVLRCALRLGVAAAAPRACPLLTGDAGVLGSLRDPNRLHAKRDGQLPLGTVRESKYLGRKRMRMGG